MLRAWKTRSKVGHGKAAQADETVTKRLLAKAPPPRGSVSHAPTPESGVY